MTEKKVVLVVVEGESDKAAFGTIFEDCFKSSEVSFHVVKGDITTKDYITSDEIVKKINEILLLLKKRYGYKIEDSDNCPSDYKRIIHITDTDGVFIPDRLVVESEACVDEKRVLYFTDHIETHSVESTIERNKRKSQVLIKLSKQSKIRNIPYKIYYNSCNLEHVLFNVLQDLDSEQKMELADDFAEKYEGKLSDFMEFISDPELAVPGTFQNTWKYIYKSNSTNSLNRHSNMHLIFE